MVHTCQISRHKFIEIEFFKNKIEHTCNWFKLHIELSTKKDHAGFEFLVDLFGYSFNITIYDCRHWNYEKQEWEK